MGQRHPDDHGRCGEFLAGKVVISMANALVKEGREMLALVPPRGRSPQRCRRPCPSHWLPPRSIICRPRKWKTWNQGWKQMCSCAQITLRPRLLTVGLLEAMPGLRPLDAGSLSQAAAIEAFTAVCITLNIRHKAHSTLRMAGI